MLLSEIGFQVSEPMNFYCDNKTAISIAHDPIQHDRTKNVEIDRHFIKDHLKAGHICMLFVQTRDQVADIFTKGLIDAQFSVFVDKLGMIDIYSPA